MRKTLFKWILIGALATGLMGAIVSCKDYSSDIDNLQSQINSLSTNVTELQTLIKQGKVVTGVEQNGSGVTITFSDGTSYTLTNGKDGVNGTNGQDGANGTNGTNGKDADVWTIGSDGYWYLNGKFYTDDNFPDGVKAVGSAGEQGLPGTNGTSYVLIPNYDTGYFDLYKIVEGTDDEGNPTYEKEMAQENYLKFADKDENAGNEGNDEGEDKGDDGEIAPAPEDHVLTAIWDGNVIHLFNVQKPSYDAEGNFTGYSYETYDIILGAQLGSVAFVPTYIDNEIFYPTTDDQYFIINSYYDEKAVDGDGEFETQSGLGVSTGVDLIYRLNPANAYVEDAIPVIINRNIKTRSFDGDKQNLIKVLGYDHNGEKLTVTTSLNPTACSTEGYDLVALRVFTGTADDQVVTSDYVVVRNAGNIDDVLLVDSTKVKAGNTDVTASWYPRTKGIVTAGTTTEPRTETSEFIHQFIDNTTANPVTLDEGSSETQEPGSGGSDPEESAGETQPEKTIADYVNYTMGYNKSFNLSNLPGLYTNNGKGAFIAKLGVTGISYEFSLPKEFNVDGVNQQTNLTLTAEDGVTYLEVIDNSTLAIDTYPVVRVDAKINGKLVGSAYILFHITGEKLDDITIDIGKLIAQYSDTEEEPEIETFGNFETVPTYFNYRKITGTNNKPDIKLSLNYNQFEEVIAQYLADYGITTLDAFWSNYKKNDYNAHYYFYHSSSEEWTSEQLEVQDNTSESTWHYNTHTGTNWQIIPSAAKDNADAVYFRIGIGNTAETQHTYGDVDGHGAEFCFVLPISSNNNCIIPDVKFIWNFFCLDECRDYDLSTLYRITNPETLAKYGLSKDAKAVLCKGQKNDEVKYEMTTKVSEHFDLGAGIFTPSDGTDNVESVSFDWAEEYEDVTPPKGSTGDDAISATKPSVGLKSPLSKPYAIRQMSYSQNLKNSEPCPNTYWIVFENPFIGVNEGTVALADESGENTADIRSGISVYDTDKDGKQNKLVVSYSEGSGFNVVEDYAKTKYGLENDDITVTYQVDESRGDWNFLKKYISNGEGYELDLQKTGEGESATYTGNIVWKNGGTKLQHSFTIFVKVTVTLGTIASVNSDVEVVLNDGYPAFNSDSDNVSAANFVL